LFGASLHFYKNQNLATATFIKDICFGHISQKPSKNWKEVSAQVLKADPKF
jgi:hypothetical protein